MSFLYPHVIDVVRPNAETAVGYQPGYAGQTSDDTSPVLTGIPASIQVRREGSKSIVGLPGDATAPFWDVFIPKRSAVVGSIESRDIVTDNLGRRFQVVAAESQSLGVRLRCVTLET